MDKDTLTKEFDSLRLQAKWSFEDMLSRFDEFKAIFKSEEEATKVKTFLTETLAKVSKL